jgi:NADH:ubiquinone oxidoreductase subunit E
MTVCRGTECHTKGSKALLDDLGLMLGYSKELEEGEPFFTTPDNKFTISTVAYFGQCALAPVVSIDGFIYYRLFRFLFRRAAGELLPALHADSVPTIIPHKKDYGAN